MGIPSSARGQRSTLAQLKADVRKDAPAHTYWARRRSVSTFFLIAARSCRRFSSGVPGSPDSSLGFGAAFFERFVGARRVIASHCRNRAQPAIAARIAVQNRPRVCSVAESAAEPGSQWACQ